MFNFIIFVIVGLVGFIIGRLSVKTFLFSKSLGYLDNIRGKAHQALSERTEERKQRILEFMKDEEARQKKLEDCSVEDKKKGVNNNDIEKLLDVSDGTANKYLNKLEKEEKIEQVGVSGRGVYYVLK